MLCLSVSLSEVCLCYVCLSVCLSEVCLCYVCLFISLRFVLCLSVCLSLSLMYICVMFVCQSVSLRSVSCLSVSLRSVCVVCLRPSQEGQSEIYLRGVFLSVSFVYTNEITGFPSPDLKGSNSCKTGTPQDKRKAL